MKTIFSQSQGVKKVAMTTEISEKCLTVNPVRIISHRNRDRQHSDRYWQDMKEDPL